MSERNRACWTFICTQRNLVHPAPGTNSNIDLRYSVDPLSTVVNLRLVPYPQAILKFHCLSSLNLQNLTQTPSIVGQYLAYKFLSSLKMLSPSLTSSMSL